MSPEIIVNNNLIANVPDETGTYKTLNGGTIRVNVDQIDADAKKQIITLESDEIGGKRVLGLTHQGIGDSMDRKRGDKKDPEVSVSLLNKPIRVTHNDRIDCNYDQRNEWSTEEGPFHWERRTVKNPYWIRKDGQRLSKETEKRIDVMVNTENEETALKVAAATNRAIESKKQPESPMHKQMVTDLLNILTSKPEAMEIFRSLQNKP
jgi:hypothetical protein